MPMPPIESSPRLNPVETLRRAAQCMGEGRFDEAERLCRDVLAEVRDFPPAIHYLGLIGQRRGDLAGAEKNLRRSIELMPSEPSFFVNLGNVLQQKGDAPGAEDMFRRALRLNPAYLFAQRNLALLMATTGRAKEAAAEMRAFAHRSGDTNAYIELGAALVRSGEHKEAVEAFERAGTLAPRSWMPHAAMARIFHRVGQLDLTLKASALARSLGGPAGELDLLMAAAYYGLDRPVEAIETADRVIAGNPQALEAHHLRALALRSQGRLDEAEAAFECALNINSKYMPSLTELVRLKLVKQGDKISTRLQLLEKDLQGLTVDDRILAYFALGKAYEDRGEFAASFEHMREANSLHRNRIVYDEAAVISTFDEVRRIWTPEFIRERQGYGSNSPIPVFIVGMVRSGSTLVEQILASHPKFAGAGEVHYFRDAFLAVLGKRPNNIGLLEFLATISGSEIQELSHLYLERLRARFIDAERVTDKLLGNCNSLGLIHIAFPNAAIIHCRRDPLDTCFSAFTQSFVESQDYCYELSELGRYYRKYHELMAHWRYLLPSAAFLDVDYEKLVTDPESEARRIVAHCGLDWDPSCLEFQTSPHPVRTASAAQVREPLYKSAVGRAGKFRSYLGPLVEALGDLAAPR